MVAEVRDGYPTETAALQAVAEKLDIGSRETLRNWVKQHAVDAGQRPGTTTEESAQLKALKKENAELKRANEILKAAASFFASMSGCWRSAGGHGPKPPLVVGP
jgi:transposase